MYHYNHYEPTSVDHLTELHGTRQEAVGALMGRFATREDEVDDLFRLGVFVDLYRVIRQGVQAGVESYSIKRLEPLCGYERQVDLAEATASLIAVEAALEDGTAAGDAGLQTVAGYNEDDCRATLALRDWLEERRLDLAERTGGQLPRPVVTEEEAARTPEGPVVTRIRSALLEVRWGPGTRRPPRPRSGWRRRCAVRTCRCRGRRAPGRPIPPPSRSSRWSRRAARSASPGRRTRSSIT